MRNLKVPYLYVMLKIINTSADLSQIYVAGWDVLRHPFLHMRADIFRQLGLICPI